MTLLQKQILFARLLSEFIWDLKTIGYQVTLGEAYRSPETCELMAKEKKGISHSLHALRLAVDLCLFKDGIYLKETSDYERAGVLWESYSTPDCECAWGGRFHSNPDGNHFSIEHEGYR